MKTNKTESNCCGSSNCCADNDTSVGRRNFIKTTSLTAAMLAVGPLKLMAGPFSQQDFKNGIPKDKKLSKEWIESLYARGDAFSATGKELEFIGMPINGIGTGQVYLGGDGSLWCWNLDGEPDDIWKEMGQGHKYMKPVTPYSPMDQGFALQVGLGKEKQVFRLDSSGFRDIVFTNKYPMGDVSYADAACPVRVQLEAYTPFIPLNRDDSSYPVTVMRYTIENISDKEQDVSIGGWIENFSNYRTGAKNSNGVRLSQYSEFKGLSVVECWAKPLNDNAPHRDNVPFDHANDFGAIALGLLGENKPDWVDTLRFQPGDEGLFDAKKPNKKSKKEQERPFSDKAYASIGRSIKLLPGASETVSFTLSWRFPNARHVTGFGKTEWTRDINYYATQWSSASASASAVVSQEKELRAKTKLWMENWYDSTLPYWFLERTFIPINCMQTQLAGRMALQDARYSLDEGVTCCEGNCTHVWHYAQGLARLFPVIERECRGQVDYDLSFKKENGAVNFRCSTKTFREAPDGQCGTILRVLRESQMTTNYSFLESIWERTKLSMDFVIKTWDKDEDGLLAGAQHNTLDGNWFGQVHWLINMYHAALKASAQMARQMNEPQVADRYEALVSKGSKTMIDLMWREDFGYFIHIPELEAEKTRGSTTGCHIDQVLGEFWLYNLGLDPVLPREKVRKTLESLWLYNFSPNIGDFRKENPKGRWYAAEGDAGLVMCTWPFGKENAQKTNFHKYYNECMSGFEWQVAAHMIWEGMLEKGLAIGKAISDRYQPKHRNPYNEVECGDHYARALASYSAFMAICGYRYNGPEGKLAFGPKMQKNNFKAAFTTAEGWGQFTQKISLGKLIAGIDLKFGRLELKEFALDKVNGVSVADFKVELDGKRIKASFKEDAEQYILQFDSGFSFNEGSRLVMSFS
ncbi:GH116 family glycosyl-hydrolase [Seonamhaeicola maritimus]|uniref:Twin-arginine translocation signal domain-containing protein n=1 Tax=Seonamhaeicola maritimus TaxID=2591822 RepID=A0A5C7GLA7_9FLAO|nr:GH116 family glycosyl-hydrolase [Seonamhaeicola maritimus]TXG39044.1 twin-arginine translocation signal domain-containing protein [Seonamhaeicola maritimus]